MVKNRIKLVLLLLMAVGILGMAVSLPLGVRDTWQRLNNMAQEAQPEPRRISLSSTVDTLEIGDSLWGDVVFKQSPDNSAYMELYDRTLLQSFQPGIEYLSHGKALLYMERVYGKLPSLSRETLEELVIMELGTYPDAVVYLPRRIRVETERPEMIGENVEYANKAK